MDNQTTTGVDQSVQANETYLKVVEIARQYLGPTAERFMNRQIEQHLGRKPEELDKRDIPELAKWVKTSAALLTDQKIATDFAYKISVIS